MGHIQDIYQHYLHSSGVTTDTRQIEQGSIFFALKGENFDGNAFAEKALEKGAMLAIIDNAKYQCSTKCILVENTLDCLQALATYHSQQLKIPVIGLTGTNGKTTTKELIHRVLSKKYRVHATVGNYNNHIGVPLTILGIKDDAEMAVIEMGANHIGEIARLCKIALPDRGLITNIGKAHLEGFGSIEGVIKAKTELFDYLRRNNGSIYVNADDPLLLSLSEGLKNITYGMTTEASQSGNIRSSVPFLEILWNQHLISTKLYGDYNFYNIMAAIAIGSSYGLEEQDIVSAIESYQPTNSRSQVVQGASNTIYLDAYNANPSSMAVAIDHFAKLKVKNKVLILGDMLELGTEEDAEHEKILTLIKGSFDQTILVGPVFLRVANNTDFPAFPDTASAIAWLEKNPINGSHILMKGSRGIAIEKLLHLL